jgi:hypothetical protein
MIPRARQWLRRNSERAFEVMMDDVMESVLDMVNSIEPSAAIVLILLIWLRMLIVANTPVESTKSDEERPY